MATIEEQIKTFARQHDAVILAHNYQRPEVQDIADFTGDSLGLSQQAAKTDAEVIVFCGVHFMAETAAILCPDKTVLLPDENAGCPMANMITLRQLLKAKQEHPDAAVVCYVNSTAAIKAESDVCCTSANAVQVVNSFPPDRELLFIPDASLGRYVERRLGRKLILWPGYCPTHHRIVPEQIRQLKQEHPDAEVVVHPECTEDVLDLADEIASTSGMLKYCRQSDAQTFLIGTETGILHQLQKESPGKTFIHITPFADCPNMKLVTLEKVLWSLEDLAPQVAVPEPTATRARRAIKRMLEVGRPS